MCAKLLKNISTWVWRRAEWVEGAARQRQGVSMFEHTIEAEVAFCSWMTCEDDEAGEVLTLIGRCSNFIFNYRVLVCPKKTG